MKDILISVVSCVIGGGIGFMAGVLAALGTVARDRRRREKEEWDARQPNERKTNQ